MSVSSSAAGHKARRQVIGILGGLGPYAHIDLESKLLLAARKYGATRDQDYPEWILSSVPQTPDRTAAIRGRGPSPLPALVRSLRRLERRIDSMGEEVPGADFVIVACNSAHHFLEPLRQETDLPVLDMIGECARHIGEILPKGAKVGLLATTGTLRGRLYHQALARHGLEAASPFDLPVGEAAQRELVMEAIYGDEGLKSAGFSEISKSLLERAARLLVEDLECRALVAGCTEVPMALTQSRAHGVPLFDPTQIIAEIAVTRAMK